MSYQNRDFLRIATTNDRINTIRLHLRANELLTPTHTFDAWFTQCRKAMATHAVKDADEHAAIQERLVDREEACNRILRTSISDALFSKYPPIASKQEDTLVTLVADLAYWTDYANGRGYMGLPEMPDIGSATTLEKTMHKTIEATVAPLRQSGHYR